MYPQYPAPKVSVVGETLKHLGVKGVKSGEITVSLPDEVEVGRNKIPRLHRELVDAGAPYNWLQVGELSLYERPGYTVYVWRPSVDHT